jgi:hypothetical protein
MLSHIDRDMECSYSLSQREREYDSMCESEEVA